jgi:hypothetical protein
MCPWATPCMPGGHGQRGRRATNGEDTVVRRAWEGGRLWAMNG